MWVQHYDDIVIGAGHNGLTTAAYLARAGRRVLVLERSDHLGGATVSAEPFSGLPARLSRYSYLVSLMPRQIMADLDLDLRLVRRRHSSYTPLPADPTRGILVDNGDRAATARSFTQATGGARDFAAWTRFYERMGRLAQRVFPTVLEPLRSEDAMRAQVDDDELWRAVVQRPLGEMLEATFDDDVVRGIVATDALIGTFADLHDQSLRQNICLLYHLIGGGTGDWDVPVGGMGAVSGALARAAADAGATLLTAARVLAVDPTDGTVTWDGGEARGSKIHAGCAPTVLSSLIGEPMDSETAPQGAQLKVNLLLTRLPRLRDTTVDPTAAFSGTFHINESYTQLQAAHAAAAAGKIPSPAPCEIYCHTLSDRSILGSELDGMHTLTIFGLHLPPDVFSSSDARRRATEETLASLNSVLAEPITDVIARDGNGELCIEARSPQDLQDSVGLPGGNIFHRSLQWPWAQTPQQVGTWGVETRYANVTICGAGARRGGGVSGIPGHNAARYVLDSH
ncbi:NAD(P)/FAD-dependent oxidoreductase [Williamsia sp. CHRR-6]|uniref:phytoene desaturase family protein n=1 Tax=Williamsia sp. CHRR-6 TaxID=2835871 RepID=UPI001BD91F27|nr:NAD(P)/FAD-dependent oxidoreductase [Williamsia sp. CHRR-6]MBT0567545.1 NAD(P)/FAD-dependent oxidoreductase [Williamsia sp. CHRR-6]